MNSIWQIVGQLIFFISIACFAIIGSTISETYNRRTLLLLWISSNIAVSFGFLFFQELNFFLVLSLCAGATFGIGYPSCSAFFADSTKIEERARVAGILILIMFFILAAIIFTSSIFEFGLFEFLLFSILLRASSYGTLLIDPCKRGVYRMKKWADIIFDKNFLMYLLPWIIFNVAVGLSASIEGWLRESTQYLKVFNQGQMLMYIGVSLSAIMSGFVSDSFGRKKSIIFGLTTLGISYGLLGLATSTTTYLISKITYGSAWGILMVSYGLTVTADFGSKGSKEKFYALGVTVPLILTILGTTLTEVFGFLPADIISQFLSMLLFVSVIPLLFAPETLPRKIRKKRQLEEHIQKVKELVRKEE